MRAQSKAGLPAPVRAWDWPTRAFHWLLVAGLVCAWVSFEFAEALGDVMLVWHRWNGYALLVLLVFRLIWGVIGASTARFSHFVRGPAAIMAYGRDLVCGRKRAFLGHNPLGTVMVLALLLAVGVQAVLGLFSVEHNEITAGPLKRLISDSTAAALTKWHVRGFKLLLGLVALHVLANLLYSVLAKDPLIPAMIKGTKPAKAYEDGAEAMVPPYLALRAALALLAAAGVVLGGITLAGGRLL